MADSGRGFRWKLEPVPDAKVRTCTIDGAAVRLPVLATFEFPNRLTVAVTVELVKGEPEATTMSMTSPRGLDLQQLQRDFRWATPMRLITEYLVARDDGTDRLYGKWQRPQSAAPMVEPNELDDAFLEEVARAYLAAGTRYSRVLADQYGVAPRSVIRWVDLARRRGILSRPETSGRVGGQIVPKSKRRPQT